MYNNTRCHIPRDRNLDTALRIWNQVAHRQLMHMVRGRDSSLRTLWCSWHRVSFGFAFICRHKFFAFVRLQHNVVGVATRYGLSGPGIESRSGRGFPHPSRPALGLTQPPVQWIPGFFPGGEAAGVRRYHPPPSSAEIRDRIELYLCSPLGLRGLF